LKAAARDGKGLRDVIDKKNRARGSDVRIREQQEQTEQASKRANEQGSKRASKRKREREQGGQKGKRASEQVS